MARPKKETVDSFLVPVTPSRVESMLRREFGGDGLIFYIGISRFLADQDGHFFDARKQVDLEFLAQEIWVPVVSVTEIIEKMVSWGFLDQELWGNKIIWFPKLVDSFADVYAKRKRPLPSPPILPICHGNPQSVTEIPNLSRKSPEIQEKEQRPRVSVTETTENPIFPSQKLEEKGSLPQHPFSQKELNKAAAAPLPPTEGEAAAAALKNFQEKESEIPPEVNSVITELIQVRGNVKVPGRFRKDRIADFSKNPAELADWKREISAAQEKAAQEKAAQEKAAAAVQLHEEKIAEKARKRELEEKERIRRQEAKAALFRMSREEREKITERAKIEMGFSSLKIREVEKEALLRHAEVDVILEGMAAAS